MNICASSRLTSTHGPGHADFARQILLVYRRAIEYDRIRGWVRLRPWVVSGVMGGSVALNRSRSSPSAWCEASFCL